MRRFIKILTILSGALALCVLLMYLFGLGYLIKGLRGTYFIGQNSANIDDLNLFDSRLVEAKKPLKWHTHNDYGTSSISEELTGLLQDLDAVALIVLKNDSILIEEYWHGHTDTSLSNSFSVAKSITTMLIQRAIQDGYIESWNEPAIKWIPELKGPYREQLLLKHLSMMTGGLDWTEHYTDPFDITARAYYGSDIFKTMINRVPIVEVPGERYHYQSGAPQLLGFVLEKATGMTVSEYASQTLWRDIGANRDAYWHLDDKGGRELTYCCFNATARDFAKIGQMLANHGKIQGQSVIDSSFLSFATVSAAAPYYGWSFWILHDVDMPVFYMRGHQGQYIIVIPEKDLVVVKLGRKLGSNVNHHNSDLRAIVDEMIHNF